jgi:hypothetical protein
MKTDVEKSDMTYLHGIRVLTLFWIILLHATGFFFVGKYIHLKKALFSRSQGPGKEGALG